MNYIAEIRAFYDWTTFNPVPADAQALWHALMHLNNRCAVKIDGQWLWRVEFTVANGTLESILKFSRTQLDRMRNALVQAGRIEYRKGRGNQSGTYRLIPFDTQYVAQTVTQADTQTVTQPVTQVWRKLCTISNYNNTPNSNFFFVGDDDAQARTSEEEAVEDFLTERGHSPERYFGFTSKTQAQAEKIAREIFSHFALKPPTKMDVTNVFECTRASIPPEDPSDHDAWRIEFPKDRIDLLMYAFEAAAGAGSPGNWNYIRGVLGKLHGRGIKNLDQADTFDFDRTERR